MGHEPADEVRLRFYDLDFTVRTDEPDLANFTRRLFARFLNTSRAPQGVLDVFRDGGNSWRVRDSTIDAVVERAEWLPGIVAARVLDTVGNEALGHDLFHAAALSHGDRGLIVSGESGYGKSTLTLALLRRGWRFLSDEVAAAEHESGRLVPFPKAIEVRPGVARLVGLKLDGVPVRRGKTLHDPETLFPGSLSGGAAPTAVVFLEAPESPQRAGDPGLLRVVVHRLVDDLPEQVALLTGVEEAAWDGERDGCPVLRIRHDPVRFAAWRLDEMLGRAGVLVVDSSAEETPPASFDREPELKPIRAHEGVARLLARFRGRRALARRLEAHGGEFGKLFLSMLERFGEAKFYRLEVGRLAATTSLMEDVV